MLAYFDCFSGISGDMTLGACIDLGVPVDWLKDRLEQLPLTDFNLTASSVTRHGIAATHARVETTEHHHHRHFSDIVALIQNSPLSEPVKETSIRIFDTIATAESGIHGCDKATVHFHEVGGIDAIVDIVGTALCLEYLGIDTVIASKIPFGRGFVTCQHGTLPVPVPAAVAILKGAPVYGTEIPHELVTPTGAGIVAALARSFEALPDMVVDKIGYGAGTRDIEERPNLLRIFTGTASNGSGNLHTDRTVMVEAGIDDMNPEIYGFLMDRLFADGALDVYWIPIFMKKNRPGTMVQVLCPVHLKETVIRRILTETTTLGVRYYELSRRMLPRQVSRVTTRFGVVAVKKVEDPQHRIRWVPEFEACKTIALEQGLPLREVYEAIIQEVRQGQTEDA